MLAAGCAERCGGREAAGSDEPGGSQAGGVAGSARAMKEEGASREATPPPPVSPGLDLAQLVEEVRAARPGIAPPLPGCQQARGHRLLMNPLPSPLPTHTGLAESVLME